MVITTVVVGLALSILKMLQRHTLDIQHFYETKNELTLLHQNLSHHFSKYENIQWDVKNERLNFRNPIEKKEIDLSEAWEGKAKLKIDERKFYLNGEKVVSGDIDAIKLSISQKGVAKVLFVYKRKDLAEVLKNGN